MVSLQAASSMITFVGDLAAENPIGPGGVANNQRHGDCHADEHEDLASLGRGGIPNRHGRRYDVRPHRYAEPGHTEEEQRQAEPEGLAMPFDRQDLKSTRLNSSH